MGRKTFKNIEHMLLFQFDQLDMTNASKIHMSLAV